MAQIIENKPEPEEVAFTFTPRQSDAFQRLEDPAIDELLYGGAKGGGKSVFGCMWACYWAKKLKDLFGLAKNVAFPPVIGFMGRKQSVDFTTTTLNTWKRFIPQRFWTLHESKKLLIMHDGSCAIQYGGFDDQATVKKFNSMELAFWFIDQAEECSETDIGMLRGTMRLKINGITPPYKGLLTANPAVCFLKPTFITNPQPKTGFIKALPTDNAYLPEDYIPRLRRAFSFNPQLLKAYLEGSWDGLDGASIVISYRDVEKCVENDQYDKQRIKRITVCDPSEDGEDETVIYDLENTKICDSEFYSHKDLMDTVGRIMAHAKQNKSNLICVDKIGIGAGVFSRLCEVYSGDDTMTIYGFDGRVSPPEGIDKETYRNYKTFAWFKAAELFREKCCDIPRDEVLMNQLSNITWHFTHGDQMILDDKETLKEQIRHSPDRADCYVMGLDALRYARPTEGSDKYKRKRLTSKSGTSPDAL